MKHALLQILAASLLLSTSHLSAQDSSSPKPDVITVIASGTGADEKAALKQAFSNAITQAVGTIVDAETLIKDDKIINDQILTTSNAIVAHYDAIGSPGIKDGLVTVKIKAAIERKQLTERLAAANVITRQVSGQDLFAQMTTDLQREKDSVAIVHRVFQDFPGNVLAAEPVDNPRIISKRDRDSEVGVSIHFSLDMAKYGQWQKAAVPVLTKLAKHVEQARWNPQIGGKELDTFKPTDAIMPGKGNPIQFSHDDQHRGLYLIRDKAAPWEKTDEPFLAVFERQGSSRVFVLYFDRANREVTVEILKAAYAIPVVEITLHDGQGNEIDGQQVPAVFGDGSEYGGHYDMNASLFRGKAMSEVSLYSAALRNEPVDLNEVRTRNDPADPAAPQVEIFPYFSNYGDNLGSVEVPGFTREFRFKLTPNQIAGLKSVQAKISSHPPAFRD